MSKQDRRTQIIEEDLKWHFKNDESSLKNGSLWSCSYIEYKLSIHCIRDIMNRDTLEASYMLYDSIKKEVGNILYCLITSKKAESINDSNSNILISWKEFPKVTFEDKKDLDDLTHAIVYFKVDVVSTGVK